MAAVTKADLEADLARERASRAQLERRLAELDAAYGQAVTERDALAAELAELRGHHETLAGEHAAVVAEQDREQAAAVEPQVRIRWIRDSPPEGCNVGPVRYQGRGPGYKREVGPGGWEHERLEALGEELTVPIGHAQVLVEAGFVEPASDRDAAWLDYDRLLHGALVHPGGRDDPATRWALDQQARRVPVPDGWPAASYAELHPDPLEPVYTPAAVAAPTLPSRSGAR